MNECKDFSEKIIFFNDLDTNEQEIVKEHIASCKNCRQHFVENQAIIADLKEYSLSYHFNHDLLLRYAHYLNTPNEHLYNGIKLTREEINTIGIHLEQCDICRKIVADVSNEMVIAKEEIFGPVLCMLVYDDIEDAIEMANDTVYGLSSGVYAKNKARALKIARRIRAGQCYIQGGYFNLEAPFGGYKQSGNGREWGDQAMHEYIETKAIIA